MDVKDILVFVRVAQAGSFSQAARLLRMPVSTVSRRVSELEAQLGVSLLLRTTRSLKMTDAGAAYFEHGKVIAAELEKAESLATHLKSEPKGKLKITATTDFGNYFLGQVVSDFLEAYPEIDGEVVLTERVVDLIEEGFDLAIRMGDLGDSTHLSKKVGSIDLQLYASPAFLRSHGEPRTCGELARLECIRFTEEEGSERWHLQGPQGATSVRVSGRVASNNMALVRDFVVAGKGVALMPHFFCSKEVQAGKLKVVLKDWNQFGGPIHIVYPGQKFTLPKVRVFVDYLARACSRVQWKPQP